MKKYYEIAGFKFCVWADESIMYKKDGPLEPFVTECCEDAYEFVVTVRECVSEAEGECVFSSLNQKIYRANNKNIRYFGSAEKDLNRSYLRIERCNNKSQVEVRRADIVDKITAKTLLDAVEIEHFCVENNGFVFHSSYIIWNGKAILFTAPSGTGKSTQADLWLKYRDAEIVNGDRSIVRAVADEVFACGLPFSGSSGICKNITVPLGAIVYLGQASQNKVERLIGIKAFRAIWEGVSVNTWDINDVSMCTDIVKKVIEEIPVYKFDCLPDESAVIELEQALKEVW